MKKGREDKFLPDLQLCLSAEKLGAEKAVITKWCKEIGDWVFKNEELAILEGTGVEVSFKSPAQGTLKKVFVQEGQMFNAGDVLGVLRTVMGGT
jgi:pyruvate/2-oxoglutarate dehydrogenase complex dihydrolipoamide acyltransferase (E2) component